MWPKKYGGPLALKLMHLALLSYARLSRTEMPNTIGTFVQLQSLRALQIASVQLLS